MRTGFLDGCVLIKKEVLSMIFLMTVLCGPICTTTVKINYLLDILIIFTNIFSFRLSMRFKCKPTTKQHLIDVMGK
jgi:hypothetical protein